MEQNKKSCTSGLAVFNLGMCFSNAKVSYGGFFSPLLGSRYGSTGYELNGDKSNDPANVKEWNPEDHPGREDFYGGDLQRLLLIFYR